MQTDDLISDRRPDLIIFIKKRENFQNCDFAVSVDQRIKLKESEKKYKHLDLDKEQKKKMEHKRDNYISHDCYFWYNHQRIIKRTRGLGKQEDYWRASKHLQYRERPEYVEVSWRLEETCCLSDSCERPSADADVKNSQGVNNNNLVLIIPLARKCN